MDLTERSREERAAAIRAARAAKRLDQASLARLADIHQATVSKAEDGRASDEVFARIERALGLPS